ncbi:glycosyltransferase family 2 protein [Sandaracinobacter sp.]|uniref:glycosyltransferase family 2 protein n=1 Tax=Sandaracinobacter sp. TaxID=2487581 RepID=UPI0035B179FF
MRFPLSIIIPTRNRPQQCAATVNAVLKFDHDFELVVFESSEDFSTEAYPLHDPRVRIVQGDSSFNMTQCFEAAVLEARRDFVCMIGDDDGVTPSLFQWVSRAARDNYTSITNRVDRYVMYNWPDVKSIYFGDRDSGRLQLLIGTNGASDADLVGERKKFLRNAGQGCGTLPRVYHGIVSRFVLEEMRSRFGQCFDGVSPDVSFSYFASMVSKRHAVVDNPLTISGQSAGSNAGRSAMHQHKGDLWSDPHMQRYRGTNWPAEIPAFFSVETVWGQATLSAIANAHPADLKDFPFNWYYALLLVKHPDRWRETMGAVRQNGAATTSGLALQLARVVFGQAMQLGGRIGRRIRPPAGVISADAADIATASQIVARYLEDA